MTVLDVGCGAGVMTVWLAQQVGPNGSVIAIDNSPEQLEVAKKNIQDHGLKNTQTQVLSAYEIEKLNYSFDAIYCRFLLHHLQSPRKVIQLFFQLLKSGGYYYGQEGIVSAAFAYPQTFAWNGYLPELLSPDDDIDGRNRDGDFGMKLLYNCLKTGFSINDCAYHQPLLWKKEQKEGLIANLQAFKNTDLQRGVTEEAWQRKYNETLRLVADAKQLVGFYGSCFIAAKMP